jgi:hypothetical protein
LPKGVLFDKHENKPKFHPFLITKEDGSRVYGGSIVFYELVDDDSICIAMQTLQTMYEAEFCLTNNNQNNQNNNENTFNNFEYFKQLNNVDTKPSTPTTPLNSPNYNILKDRLYTTKCISVISQYPFNFAFHKILQTLYDMVKNTDLLGISLESHIYNLVYEVPMIEPANCMKFHVGCKAISVYMPSNNDLRIFEYDLFEFFMLLGVNNIVNLFATALLEHQILLYSKGKHSFFQ